MGGGDLDEPAIKTFLEQDYPRVVGVVALMSGDTAAAEDAVCEALARAWERSERGEAIENLGAWVTTVAMNLTRSRWRRILAERRARARMAVAEASADPDVGIDVRRALRSLSPRHREVLLLHHYLGFDVNAVARHLGIPAGTVKSSLHRARAAMARYLSPDEESHVRAR